VHAGDELGEGEGLRQVVVRTEVEPFDTIAYGRGRREHEDARLRRGVDEGGAHRVAVHPGKVPIQHHHVVANRAFSMPLGPS
jgi:hypothetical protein